MFNNIFSSDVINKLISIKNDVGTNINFHKKAHKILPELGSIKFISKVFEQNLKHNINVKIIDVNTKYEIPIYIEVTAKNRNKLNGQKTTFFLANFNYELWIFRSSVQLWITAKQYECYL